MRERLLTAAEACFEENGIGRTSMLDIARSAGVSRTTLYKHFPSIEDVLKATFTREFDRFEKRLRAKLRKCQGPVDRLVETVVGLAENAPKNAGITELVAGPRNRTEEKALSTGRSALDDRVIHLINDPLEELATTNRLRDDVSREYMVEWIRTQVNAFSAIRNPGRYPKKTTRSMIMDFLVYAILKPE